MNRTKCTKHQSDPRTIASWLPLLCCISCTASLSPAEALDTGVAPIEDASADAAVDSAIDATIDAGTQDGSSLDSGTADALASSDASAPIDAGALPTGCPEVDLSGSVSIAALDTWIEVTPTVVLPSGRTGAFGNRGWTKMVYDTTRHVFLLWEGYAESPGEYPYTIYSNALWTYDPVQNELALDKAHHWYNGPGGGYDTIARPENATDPTPGDRHQTRTFAFAPDEGAAFQFSGLNQALERPSGIGHPIDLWRYDVRSKTWAELFPAVMPATHSEDQAMVYAESERKLVLFGAHETNAYRHTETWVFDLASEAWSFSQPDPSPPSRPGAPLELDARRGRAILFGGGWNVGLADMWSFDVTTNAWSQLSDAPIGTRGAHGFAYDCRHDRFLETAGRAAVDLAPEYSDTWVWSPEDDAWTMLEDDVAEGPSGNIWGDMTYSPAHDVFLALSGSEDDWHLWILRLDPANLR